jgi:hypothetical protein
MPGDLHCHFFIQPLAGRHEGTRRGLGDAFSRQS